MDHTNISLFLLLLFSASIQAAVRNQQTMMETLPAYAMAVNNNVLNTSRCQEEMEQFREAVDRGVVWSLRMLDTSGEPGTGFMGGNNYWLGDRLQCKYLTSNVTLILSEKALKNNSRFRDPEKEFPPFELNFFSARFRHNSTMQYHIEIGDENQIILGLCLPASCTGQELGKMLQKVFDDRTLLVGRLYSADFRQIEIYDMKDDSEWLLNGKMIVIILILVLLFCTVLVGTLYDIIIYQSRLQRKRQFLTFENNNTSEMKNDMEEKRDIDHEESGLSELKPENRMEEVLVTFSAYSNIQQIFKIERHTEGVSSIHGMKFFGMVWIILGHTIFYENFIAANRSVGYIMSQSIMSQLAGNAPFSVDTYFFISGFLLTLMFLKSRLKDNKPVRLRTQVHQFCFSLIKRYIRLSPAYFTVILISILNFSWYEKTATISYFEPIQDRCSKYWWRNIFYMNNFYDWDELSWSWYLSNDMQFFIFGSILLLLSVTHFYAALGLGIVSIISSIIMNVYTVYSISYVPTLDTYYANLSWLYVRPWIRIPPYLIGMATAHLLVKWNYKLHLPRKVLALCWIIGATCNCSAIFVILNHYWPITLSILYVTFSRIIWAFGISWVIVACCTDNAGVVNKFLSLRMWIPLSRLTYCAYLLNPFLIISMSLFSNYVTFIDVLATGTVFLGVLTVSYVCAMILSLTTEVPFILMLRLLANRDRRRK
ncbi:Nose resistant to fluoxetine protein 6 [Habropoda laboriosa]|uniref:Nose resistant to fluoxetine protein 6 n=1 Tax=Habropoda laboriosa TaxID=597456 RepID=A0A0L7R592_9HYME|nr:Nose resistant to fluoxetine protein 6 [Habropoda laboriosa]